MRKGCWSIRCQCSPVQAASIAAAAPLDHDSHTSDTAVSLSTHATSLSSLAAGGGPPALLLLAAHKGSSCLVSGHDLRQTVCRHFMRRVSEDTSHSQLHVATCLVDIQPLAKSNAHL